MPPRKKILEKNNSLKLMLSHRYVDLLDCSDLIEDLTHYTNQINKISQVNSMSIIDSLGNLTKEIEKKN